MERQQKWLQFTKRKGQKIKIKQTQTQAKSKLYIFS